MIQSESEFLQFAMRHYDNPGIVSMDEFNDDLKKFVYISSLVNRYKSKKEPNERLLLNHIIVTFNVFGDHAKDMFYYKFKDLDQLKIIETYMFFLNHVDRIKTEIDFALLVRLQKL